MEDVLIAWSLRLAKVSSPSTSSTPWCNGYKDRCSEAQGRHTDPINQSLFYQRRLLALQSHSKKQHDNIHHEKDELLAFSHGTDQRSSGSQEYEALCTNDQENHKKSEHNNNTTEISNKKQSNAPRDISQNAREQEIGRCKEKAKPNKSAVQTVQNFHRDEKKPSTCSPRGNQTMKPKTKFQKMNASSS
jgi:hypothetical protein